MAILIYQHNGSDMSSRMEGPNNAALRQDRRWNRLWVGKLLLYYRSFIGCAGAQVFAITTGPVPMGASILTRRVLDGM